MDSLERDVESRLIQKGFKCFGPHKDGFLYKLPIYKSVAFISVIERDYGMGVFYDLFIDDLTFRVDGRSMLANLESYLHQLYVQYSGRNQS